jgi:hypothetical protein
MRQAAALSATKRLYVGLSLGAANGSFAHRRVASSEFYPSDATWLLRAAIDQGLIVNLNSWRGRAAS